MENIILEIKTNKKQNYHVAFSLLSVIGCVQECIMLTLSELIPSMCLFSRTAVEC